jgi:DNA-binding response OmpR family regulator
MHDARVLIVEDDALIAMAMEDTLLDAGFAVIAVQNGASAIGKLEAECGTIDAVITDIRMPGGITGWDVGVRARELKASMPLIYCSGDKAADWRARGVSSSIMFGKPFDLNRLVTTLTELVTTNAPKQSAN